MGDDLEPDAAPRSASYRREAATPGLSVEQKRALVRGVRGVNYDARVDRFTASITVEGERRWLGCFTTVTGAAAAYEAVRRENPVARAGGTRRDAARPTIAKAYVEFRKNCSLDQYGHPARGEVFATPDGQRFKVVGKYNYKPKKGGTNRAYCFLSWNSLCAVCGAKYETKTLARAKAITSITRTCKEHRGKLGVRKASRPDAPEIEVLVDDGPVAADYACMGAALMPYDTAENDDLSEDETHDDRRRIWYWDDEAGASYMREPHEGEDLI